MCMNQRVDHIDPVGRIVQYPPNGRYRIVQLPEHAAANHEHQIV